MHCSSIGSDNGLLPDRRQVIAWTTVCLLSIEPSETKCREITRLFINENVFENVICTKVAILCMGDELNQLFITVSLKKIIDFVKRYRPWCLLEMSNFTIAMGIWSASRGACARFNTCLHADSFSVNDAIVVLSDFEMFRFFIIKPWIYPFVKYCLNAIHFTCFIVSSSASVSSDTSRNDLSKIPL